jgi:hypothetical protein
VASAIETLADADAKLEWADKHIAKFEREIQLFHERKSYVIWEQIQPEGSRVLQFTDPPDVPPQLVMLASDAVHNIRAALDYLTCALAIDNGKSTSSVSFPVARDENELGKPPAQRKIHKLSTKARAFIIGLKPYKGGNDHLWAIHEIDRVDKHLNRLGFYEAPPMMYFTRIDIGEDDDSLDVTERAPKHELERIGLLPAFADIDVFQGESALTLLKQFSSRVADILSEARRLFFPNTQRVSILGDYSL